MIHIQLLSVPVCTIPYVVDATDQDCLTTLHGNSLVETISFYPIPRLTITFCFPTCIIPTDIKSGIFCDRFDVLNKASMYVINFVVWILTVLSFICCYVVVAEFFGYF